MFYQFHTEIAEKLGIEKAVILHCLYTWIVKNSANNRNAQDGRYWTYNTTEAWQKLLPFMSSRSIRRYLESLNEEGYLLKANYNETGRDRTMWYAISDKGTKLLEEKGYNISVLYEIPFLTDAKCQSGQMQVSKLDKCTLYNNNTYSIKEKYNTNVLYKKKAEEKENFEETADDCMSTKDNSLPPYGETPPPTPSPKESKEQRLIRAMQNFTEQCREYIGEFGEQLVQDFIDYWSEPNKSHTKMRYELQPTWDLHRRLLTWQRRSKQRYTQYGDYIKRKQEDKQRSDIESLQRLSEIESRRAAGIEEVPDDIMPWERT